MSIQSATYFAFVLVAWLFSLRARTPRSRQWWLLAASYAFYATWGFGSLVLLVSVSLMNFGWGGTLKRRRSAGLLWIAVASNFLILVIFRYLPAAVSGRRFSLLEPLAQFIAPAGISFWMFQSLSYLIDIYRGEMIDATLPEFCLYLAFWPTVLAGPINRLWALLPQFRSTEVRWDDIAEGSSRIVTGLFMKMVLADILHSGFQPGEGVVYGFDQIPGGWGAIDVLLLGIGFGFELFFDFAGYTHIAVGVARLFGIKLQENFRSPYFSVTISEFWTRWHMSLSFWIRDYVFLPLSAVKRVLWWRYAALFLSMVCFGLWHGATIPFILWGAYQGTLLCCHRLWQQTMRRHEIHVPGWLSTGTSWALTMFAVTLGWVVFRSHNVSQLVGMLSALFHPASYKHIVMRGNFYILVPSIVTGYVAFGGISAWLRRINQPALYVSGWRLILPVYYAVVVFMIIAWSTENPPFIYFQF